MKRILRSRLPQRFADKVPPVVVEIAVSLLVVALMTLLRVALVPWIGDRTPYAFVFVAVAATTVLAGWRSGLLALVLGQLLAWNLIVDLTVPRAEVLHLVGGFIIATLAEVMVLAILYLYQREVDRAWSRREEQVDLIHHALAEMDHRTVNNYQTVLALVSAQAQRADAPVKAALEQVSDRIRAIAMVSKQLAVSSGSLEQVRIAPHLRELCAELKKGLSRPNLLLESEVDDIGLTADRTNYVSILVNELVTNSIKHAFPDNRAGVIRVILRQAERGLDLAVEDNGVGIEASGRPSGTGLGTRLVQTFTRQLGATYQLETGAHGTRHRVHIPGSG